MAESRSKERLSAAHERSWCWNEYATRVRAAARLGGEMKTHDAQYCDAMLWRIDELDKILAADAARDIPLKDLLSARMEFHLPAVSRTVDRFCRVDVDERALAKTPSGAGGALVPTDFRRELYEYLTTASSIYKLNVTILDVPGRRQVQVPTQVTPGTAVLVGEGTAIPHSDPTFGQVTLGAYKFGVMLDVSNEFVEDVDIDLDSYFATRAGQAFELGYGPYFASSGAHVNQPEGLLHGLTTGATIQTAATGVPSYANLLATIDSVPAQYRRWKSQWLMPATAVKSIRTVTDTGGFPIWQPATQVGEPDRLLGYPVVVDANLSAGTAGGTAFAFGAFNGYFLRDGGINIKTSEAPNFSTDMMTVRAYHSLDGAWADTTGVRALVSPTS